MRLAPGFNVWMLKVTQYSFNTIYVKHDGVPIVDCLSRNVTIDTAREDKSLNITIAAISLFQEGKLHQIKWETAKDILLVKLAHVIQNGWPVQCSDLDQELYVFWVHRLNLSIVDGIIMNRTHIVIPKSLQTEYLKCLHTGHFGVSKHRARAKSTVYWPGIDQDITNLIRSCDVCREVQHTPCTFDKHTTEACYPGHIYGTDTGNIQGKPHVIVVDYFSFFIYKRPLPDMTSDTVILALKTTFSEAGVPTILISDNGRQYCSGVQGV